MIWKILASQSTIFYIIISIEKLIYLDDLEDFKLSALV